MMRLKQVVAAVVVVGVAAAGAMGQMSIEPPTGGAAGDAGTTTQETARPPLATAPTTQGASATTAPATGGDSAQEVLEGLLKERPEAPTGTALHGTGGKGTAAESAAPEAAPHAPKVNRIREGELVYNRTGRMIRDEKTGNWIFVFDGDGKVMQDPPMQLLPSKMLMAMEKAQTSVTEPTRFRVSGQVTEYNDKNYLLVSRVEILRDLNKGIGG